VLSLFLSLHKQRKEVLRKQKKRGSSPHIAEKFGNLTGAITFTAAAAE